VEVPINDTETLIRDKMTGQSLVFRLRKELLAKYLNVPEEKQAQAGREVAARPTTRFLLSPRHRQSSL
jgi:hypothetical protein